MEVLRGAWLARRFTGLGAAVPLNCLQQKSRPPKLTEETSRRCLRTALERRTGPDRVQVLITLLSAAPFLRDPDCFGKKEKDFGRSEAWHTAVLLLKGMLNKEYSAAERAAAGVGGEQCPHTLAQAIVLLEHRRELEAASAPGPAQPAAAAGAAQSPPPPPQVPPQPVAAAAAAFAARRQALRDALEEERDTAARLARCREKVRKEQQALQNTAMQAAAGAPGLAPQALGASRRAVR